MSEIIWLRPKGSAGTKGSGFSVHSLSPQKANKIVAAFLNLDFARS